MIKLKSMRLTDAMGIRCDCKGHDHAKSACSCTSKIKLRDAKTRQPVRDKTSTGQMTAELYQQMIVARRAEQSKR
jgi:hypothetical protein